MTPTEMTQTKVASSKATLTKKTRLGFAILGMSLLAFCVIAYFVMTGYAVGFDDPVRNFIYGLRVDGLNTLLEAITYLGNWQSLVVICLLLLAYDKTRIPYGVLGSTVAIGEFVLNRVLKEIFARTRPEDVLPLIQQGGYAFPSGHSVASVAFYGLLLFLVQTKMEDKKMANRLSVVLIILIALIGPSRIYLGVHYPTDVLAGWAEGVFVATAVYMLATKFVPKSSLKQSTEPDTTDN